MDQNLQRVAGKQTLVLTHYGRNSGQPRTVTIWFAAHGDKIYLSTANVQRQWVRNVQKTPRVKLSIGTTNVEGNARFLTSPSERKQVLSIVFRKYWMFWPITATWRMLQRTGLMKDTTGAFEVTLTPN